MLRNVIVVVLIALIVGSFAFIAGRRAVMLSLWGHPDDREGLVQLRFPTSGLPPIVHSVSLSFERKGGGARADSFVVQRTGKPERIATFGLPAGDWTLYIRGHDAEGWTRYAGIARIRLEEGEDLSGIVRMNPLAGKTTRKEVVIRWGEKTERWEMSLNNPVLAADHEGWDRDHYYLVDPVVVRLNERYLMWYGSGFNPYYTGTDSMWIAMAISDDGHVWEKKGPVRFTLGGRVWVGKLNMPGSVIVEGEQFWLWFSDSTRMIRRATSKDGISWTLDPKPVIVASALAPQLLGPWVVKNKNQYSMYFTIRSKTKSGNHNEIWRITSTDGEMWTAPVPVLEPRNGVAWESNGVGEPCVVLTPAGMQMFYAGIAREGALIGEARSTDGTTWTDQNLIPTIGPTDTEPWSTRWTYGSCALVEEGRLRIWFTGFSDREHRWQIGTASRPL